MKPIPQEYPLGCAISCVASLCDMTYKEARELFADKDNDKNIGFGCQDIINALAGVNKFYNYKKYDKDIFDDGTIVFVDSQQYLFGHFLVKDRLGWMNSWANCPCLFPIAEFQHELCGLPMWVIYEK
jgi:hypothetical protein